MVGVPLRAGALAINPRNREGNAAPKTNAGRAQGAAPRRGASLKVDLEKESS